MAGVLVKVGRLQVATPESLALAIRQPTVAQDAVDERIGAQVQPLVAAAIADDDTVVQAAADAVDAKVDELEIVQFSDPAIPREVVLQATLSTGEVLDEATLDEADGLLEGRFGGTKYLPRLRTEQVSLSTTETVESAAVFNAAAGTQIVDNEGNAWWAEDRVDENGLIPAETLAAWKTRGGFGTGLSGQLDIVLVLGQSNATQRSSVPVPLFESDPTVHQWSGAWNIAGGTPWLGSGFAAGLRHRNPARAVGIVRCSAGSTGFSSLGAANGHWNHGQTGTGPDLATQAVLTAQAALAAAPSGSRIVAVLWSQGEQDRGMTAVAYQAKLDELIGWVRAQLSLPELPWIISSMTPNLQFGAGAAPGGPAIEAVLEDTPRRVRHTAHTVGLRDMSEATESWTGIHWTPAGQHERGQEWAHLPLTRALLNRADAEPATPRNLAVTRSGDTVTITWEHPASGLVQFILETSTDEGTTWTPQTLTAPITRKHTMSVAPGIPVWARITAECISGTSITSLEVHA